MELRKYEEYKMFLSFEQDIKNIERYINEIPVQTGAGHSKIGYMTTELNTLRCDLLEITKKHKEMIENLKQNL